MTAAVTALSCQDPSRETLGGGALDRSNGGPADSWTSQLSRTATRVTRTVASSIHLTVGPWFGVLRAKARMACATRQRGWETRSLIQAVRNGRTLHRLCSSPGGGGLDLFLRLTLCASRGASCLRTSTSAGRPRWRQDRRCSVCLGSLWLAEAPLLQPFRKLPRQHCSAMA